MPEREYLLTIERRFTVRAKSWTAAQREAEEYRRDIDNYTDEVVLLEDVDSSTAKHMDDYGNWKKGSGL